MNVGDLVWFPCDMERYQKRIGVLVEIRDNPADLTNVFMKRNERPPRKIADILYKGKMTVCWVAHLKEAIHESR